MSAELKKLNNQLRIINKYRSILTIAGALLGLFTSYYGLYDQDIGIFSSIMVTIIFITLLSFNAESDIKKLWNIIDDRNNTIEELFAEIDVQNEEIERLK